LGSATHGQTRSGPSATCHPSNGNTATPLLTHYHHPWSHSPGVCLPGGIPLPASTDRGPAPPLDDCRGIAAASAVLGSVVVWAVRVVRQRRIPLTPLIPSETLLSGIVSVFYVVRCLDCSVAEQGKPIRLEARITTAISLGVGRPSYENVP